jgi:hypothetical protein
MLKGAAAPRSSDERLMVKPLMMHCRASHTVDMACIVQNLPRVLYPSGRKTAHRGAPARCRVASGKTRLQAAVASRKNTRAATTARQSPLLPQTGQPHNYVLQTPTTCSPPDAFDAVKAPGVSAPGAPQAQEGYTDTVNLSGGNPISQTVNTPSMTIVNTTKPGHVFYPGTVTWQVSPSPTGSTIQVTGTGTGAHPYVNDIVGELFFGLMSYLIQTGCNAAAGAPNY